jgi:LysR family transcriptional regulator of gallate degradation
MSPTVFGRALAERARAVRSELRHAHDEINTLRGAEQGHVLVGALPSFAASVLPVAVAEMQSIRPGVRVTVYEGLADSLVGRVLSGDLDFIIMTLRATAIDPGLEQEFLQTRELSVVVMGSGHPFRARETLAVEELGELKWVLPPKPDGLRLDFERLFESVSLAPPLPMVESNSVLFIRSILRETDVVTYLPTQLVRQDLEQKTLTYAEINTDRRQTDVGFLYRRQSLLTPAARMLMDGIKAICQPPRP